MPETADGRYLAALASAVQALEGHATRVSRWSRDVEELDRSAGEVEASLRRLGRDAPAEPPLRADARAQIEASASYLRALPDALDAARTLAALAGPEQGYPQLAEWRRRAHETLARAHDVVQRAPTDALPGLRAAVVDFETHCNAYAARRRELEGAVHRAEAAAKGVRPTPEERARATAANRGLLLLPPEWSKVLVVTALVAIAASLALRGATPWLMTAIVAAVYLAGLVATSAGATVGVTARERAGRVEGLHRAEMALARAQLELAAHKAMAPVRGQGEA